MMNIVTFMHRQSLDAYFETFDLMLDVVIFLDNLKVVKKVLCDAKMDDVSFQIYNMTSC